MSGLNCHNKLHSFLPYVIAHGLESILLHAVRNKSRKTLVCSKDLFRRGCVPSAVPPSGLLSVFVMAIMRARSYKRYFPATKAWNDEGFFFTQDLHSMIHPHLYGLPTLGVAVTAASAADQNQSGGVASSPKTSTSSEGSAVDDKTNPLDANRTFHNFAPTDWDVFAKTSREKLVLSGASHVPPAAATTQDWFARPHQVGNCVGVNALASFVPDRTLLFLRSLISYQLCGVGDAQETRVLNVITPYLRRCCLSGVWDKRCVVVFTALPSNRR